MMGLGTPHRPLSTGAANATSHDTGSIRAALVDATAVASVGKPSTASDKPGPVPGTDAGSRVGNATTASAMPPLCLPCARQRRMAARTRQRKRMPTAPMQSPQRPTQPVPWRRTRAAAAPIGAAFDPLAQWALVGQIAVQAAVQVAASTLQAQGRSAHAASAREDSTGVGALPTLQRSADDGAALLQASTAATGAPSEAPTAMDSRGVPADIAAGADVEAVSAAAPMLHKSDLGATDTRTLTVRGSGAEAVMAAGPDGVAGTGAGQPGASGIARGGNNRERRCRATR